MDVVGGTPLQWRVNTPAFLREIMANDGMAVLAVPMQIFGNLLAAVAERAAEMHDPELDKLMVRLALYSVADPYSPDYSREVVEQVLSR